MLICRRIFRIENADSLSCKRLSYPRNEAHIPTPATPMMQTNKAKVMSQRIFMMPILRQLECLLPTGSLVCLKDRFWPILLKNY